MAGDAHAARFHGTPLRRPSVRRAAAGGLRCEGFFVEPACEDPACCRPAGPFPTEAAARAWGERMARAEAAGDVEALIALSVEADLLRDEP